MDNLIEVRNLEVTFSLKEGLVRAVNGVDLDIPPGKTLGIVGESGCGKSVTARAILRILPSKAEIVSGSIRLAPREGKGEPVDLVKLDPRGNRIRNIRGGDISMIFQEPMTSLSPLHTIGNQIMETVLLHQDINKKEARNRAIEALREVGVPMPEKRVDSYPYELSGGLRQRCMIAMALSCRPRLLIADEPTTALDVTIQAQILELIEKLQKQLNMSVIMITHDLGVIAETADTVAVMYLGRVVETAPSEVLFENPTHPYTKGLLASVPKIGRDRDKDLPSVPGKVPHPFEILQGCPFHPRCSECIIGVCDKGTPPLLRERSTDHFISCHLDSTDFAPIPICEPDEGGVR